MSSAPVIGCTITAGAVNSQSAMTTWRAVTRMASMSRLR
jgi:hypothetical protein